MIVPDCSNVLSDNASRGAVRDADRAGRPSALVLSALTADFEPEQVRRGVEAYAAGGVTLVARSQDETAGFFKGLEVVDPGIVSVVDWRPELALDETPDGKGPVSLYGGVGVKR
jgi:hypothetical protein